ncbi:flagellar FliJ family protein [Helicobacter suis]|uniref:flagellar FliJ family protein n=1 Tax=Helicobacter suis TaxID=104628 RepID=UPI0013D04ADD|nr:flagellar FliJ family protein [Helicobacter suis]
MNLESFKKLVKIKKQAMQRCESDIAHNKSQIASKQEQQHALLVELYGLSVPAEGGFNAFIQLSALKKNYLYQIERIGEEISQLKEMGRHLKELYKNASIEYEKFKYLQTLEEQKKLKRLKKLEDQQMDSIGAEIFYQQQRENRA